MTYIYISDRRYNLGDRLGLKISGVIHHKTVRDWVNTNPRLLFKYVCEPTSHNLPRVKLHTKAHVYLRDCLKKEHPDLDKWFIAQKIKAKLRNSKRA